MKNKYAIIILALSLIGCGLPQGTRSITAWGVGAIPISGVPIPFIGYWSSTHGTDTENYNPAQPPAPSPLSAQEVKRLDDRVCRSWSICAAPISEITLRPFL